MGSPRANEPFLSHEGGKGDLPEQRECNLVAVLKGKRIVFLKNVKVSEDQERLCVSY